MRRTLSLLLVCAPLVSAGVASGCSSGHNGAASDAGLDAYGVIVGQGDGAAGDAPGEASNTVQTSMRLVHASPNLGPVDFCWRPAGAATWVGPVLAGPSPAPGDAGEAGGDGAAPPPEAGALPDGGAGTGDGEAADTGPGTSSDASFTPDADTDAEGDSDGAAPSADAADDGASGDDAGLTVPDAAVPGALVFGTIAPVVQLQASGTFDVALVPTGGHSCVTRTFVAQVTLDAGKHATAVILGLAGDDAGASALSIVSFTDGTASPQAARVRMIHAALGTGSAPPAPSLSVRAGTVLVTPEVDPRQVSAASTSAGADASTPSIDALGYTSLAALPPPTAFTLTSVGDAAAAKWTTGPAYLGAGLGSSHTGILVSLGAQMLGVLWCNDVNPTGAPAACSLYPAP